jgi:radical SAM domain protein
MEQSLDDRVYAVNPNYFLRKDSGLGLIYAGEDRVCHAHEASLGFVSFCHLALARAFVAFDGQRTFREAVAVAAQYIPLPEEKLAPLLQRYLENAQALAIPTKWHIAQSIPEHMLVEVKPGVVYRAYDEADFAGPAEALRIPSRLEWPLTAYLMLTMHCVTDCAYCYAKRNMMLGESLSLNRVLSLIEEAAELKMAAFDPNGGDVFTYPHWREVVAKLLACGFNPFLSTKKPLSKEEVEQLRTLGVNRLQLSIDSLEPQVVEKTQHVPSGEHYVEDMRATLAQLTKAGMRVNINTVLSYHNADKEQVRAFLKEILVYGCIRRVSLTAAGYSLYIPQGGYLPRLDDVLAVNDMVEREFAAQIAQGRVRVTGYAEKPSPDPNVRAQAFAKRAFCTANTRNLVILPDGKVTVCEELYDYPEFIIGDLKKQTIRELWTSQKALSLFQQVQSTFPDDSACKHCEDFVECRQGKGVCYKNILKAYGIANWQYPDPGCSRAGMPTQQFWLE